MRWVVVVGLSSAEGLSELLVYLLVLCKKHNHFYCIYLNHIYLLTCNRAMSRTLIIGLIMQKCVTVQLLKGAINITIICISNATSKIRLAIL